MLNRTHALYSRSLRHPTNHSSTPSSSPRCQSSLQQTNICCVHRRLEPQRTVRHSRLLTQIDSLFYAAAAAMTVNAIVSEPGLVAALQISDQARDQAHALLHLTDEASDAPASAELQAETAKKQKYFFTSISQLRGLHRNACIAARETKTQTAEARQAVDRLHLQLQNLYYEQRHLQGEIVACESYECVVPGISSFCPSFLTLIRFV